jgi:hypothetical protein
MFSRDVIWLNKTYSHHMGISQDDIITNEEENNDVEEEKIYKMDILDTNSNIQL